MADSPIQDVEVKIRFCVGEVSKSLRELAEIQPGFLFETDQEFDQPVTIEVNGAVLGRGELVRIGNKLGVRVKEYSGNVD